MNDCPVACEVCELGLTTKQEKMQREVTIWDVELLVMFFTDTHTHCVH